MVRGLTERQQQILEFLVEAVEERGLPPTLREIADRFGIRSTHGVARHLEALERKGFIRRDSRARAIQVCPEVLRRRGAADSVGMVPLLAEVAAGQPITAVEDAEGFFPVPAEWLSSSSSNFLLRVRGRSMAEAIQPGDLVLVERCSTARNGEIVVARIEDEATVKRYYREPGRIVLRADNPDYDNLVFTDDVPILGRVTALFRRYR